MYLACADKVIEKRQSTTEQRCRGMIARQSRKPWPLRLFGRDAVRQAIIDEWQSFEEWMDNRIAFMRKANVEAEPSRKQTGE